MQHSHDDCGLGVVSQRLEDTIDSFDIGTYDHAKILWQDNNLSSTGRKTLRCACILMKQLFSLDTRICYPRRGIGSNESNLHLLVMGWQSETHNSEDQHQRNDAQAC